jgi:hypothetical protein
MQRPLPDNTQHSQETYIHAPGGTRNRNPSKLVAADPGLRPSGYWDQSSINIEKSYWDRGAKKLEEKPVRLPHCPPQIPTARV